MKEQEVISKIDVRIAELRSYKNGLSIDVVEAEKLPLERQMFISDEKKKADAGIAELEKLKKVIYTS